MPTRAILYIAAVICAGAGALIHAALNWTMQDPALFFGLLALALCLSTMKITLPRMTGTMAAGFVPVLAAVALLSSGEAAVIASASGILQTVWRARVRPSVAQIAFNGAVLGLSALAAYHVAHWTGAGIGNASVIAIVTVAVMVDYLVDTLLVSAVLCLIERKSLLGIFRICNLWALPYYVAGALITGSLVSLGLTPQWRVVIPTLPVMWAVFDCYRQYVAALARD